MHNVQYNNDNNSNNNNNNTFDRRNNNYSNNRFGRQYKPNSGYDKNATLREMRSEWRCTDERKRFRSNDVDDRVNNNNRYNGNRNNIKTYNNNDNVNEGEKEHEQLLKHFRDNSFQSATSFPTR